MITYDITGPARPGPLSGPPGSCSRRLGKTELKSQDTGDELCVAALLPSTPVLSEARMDCCARSFCGIKDYLGLSKPQHDSGREEGFAWFGYLGPQPSSTWPRHAEIPRPFLEWALLVEGSSPLHRTVPGTWVRSPTLR